jgi:hypothetical protein
VRVPEGIERGLARLRRQVRRGAAAVAHADRRVLAGGAAALAVAALAWALTTGPLSGDDEPEVQTRVVTVPIETDDAAQAPVGALGFPLVATRNTTRVGGQDPATDAAAIALATHPPSPDAEPLEAAILVGPDDWQAGIAASVLAGPPVRAPILVGEPDGLPDVTADALAKLNPVGGPGPEDAAVYLLGDVRAPDGYVTRRLTGETPAEQAAAVDRLRSRLLEDEPEHVLVASADDPAFAMPAAGWAARSGDPVLFAGRDELPRATALALSRHRESPVYVIGPEDVIGEQVVRRIRRVAPAVQRIGEEDAVENSIAFARYAGSGFGWNINDPGHGLVLANAERPLDAAAASSLSAGSRWGPLLVIEDAGTLPPTLRSFLLDIKPGFEDDPTRAVYNHVWVIGDSSAVGATVQAEVDELAELVQIGAGAGGPGGETDADAGDGGGTAP